MSRAQRANVAQQTLAICESRRYTSPSGRLCDMIEALGEALDATQLYRPSDKRWTWARCAERLTARASCAPARLEVRNETTLSAARRLLAEGAEGGVLALNFASAKNPGGGFLGGSQAQEESLARASALYPCLLTQPDYYSANRACGTALYTDHMIYAPRVPVFRDDHDQLTEDLDLISFITAPAPNAGALRDEERRRLRATFEARTDQLLAWACALGYTRLVLGAWGCGVFRNDPATVAEIFALRLGPGGSFAQAFEVVAFGVLDSHGGATLRAFEEALG